MASPGAGGAKAKLDLMVIRIAVEWSIMRRLWTQRMRVTGPEAHRHELH
jgi:hypothetical protein